MLPLDGHNNNNTGRSGGGGGPRESTRKAVTLLGEDSSHNNNGKSMTTLAVPGKNQHIMDNQATMMEDLWKREDVVIRHSGFW